MYDKLYDIEQSVLSDLSVRACNPRDQAVSSVAVGEVYTIII